VCTGYLENIANYYYALPCYGLVVSIVNWALQRSILVGGRWLKFRDVTSQATFQLTLLYVVQFINMAFPLAFLNINLSQQSWVLAVQQELYFDFAGPRSAGIFFFGGRFHDTNRLWLNQINQPIHFVIA
jgi:hypothetical protein